MIVVVMDKERDRISGGKTFEEVKAFLLKLARRNENKVPPPHVVSTLELIEARGAEIKERGKAKPAIV